MGKLGENVKRALAALLSSELITISRYSPSLFKMAWAVNHHAEPERVGRYHMITIVFVLGYALVFLSPFGFTILVNN